MTAHLTGSCFSMMHICVFCVCSYDISVWVKYVTRDVSLMEF